VKIAKKSKLIEIFPKGTSSNEDKCENSSIGYILFTPKIAIAKTL